MEIWGLFRGIRKGQRNLRTYNLFDKCGGVFKAAEGSKFEVTDPGAFVFVRCSKCIGAPCLLPEGRDSVANTRFPRPFVADAVHISIRRPQTGVGLILHDPGP
ncbi:hypothetical protein CC2G_011555 [Coprinopsis cinerea AmutBmut pab1-1]|nr:hypothetical protein CC2G_011555 [Coprinopsis cinerea AmutBmut pab1-1]